MVYFSKIMLLAECNYTIYNKELLAIIRAFKQWRTELKALDKPMNVYLDHKALKYFIIKKDLLVR